MYEKKNLKNRYMKSYSFAKCLGVILTPEHRQRVKYCASMSKRSSVFLLFYYLLMDLRLIENTPEPMMCTRKKEDDGDRSEK